MPVTNENMRDENPRTPWPEGVGAAAPVAILFARADSVFKTIAGCDVWDADRDARQWPGGAPAIARPPCRAWGRLRAFAKPLPGEKELALHAVERIRRWGGVLEHPEASTLWREAGLPPPGARDAWGGWTLPAAQKWWGRRAEKRMWLYIVGVEPRALPPFPIVLGEAPCTVYPSRRRAENGERRRPFITKAEREHAPRAFAEWLVALARRAVPPGEVQPRPEEARKETGA